MTSDEDGVVVQMQATGALVTARRISGSGEGGDRVEAVAFNTTGTRSYAAGRVVSPTGFDAYTLDLIDDRMDTRSSSGGLVVAKSLVSPSPTEICEAGHYQGEIDLGEGVMRRADGEASYVRCSAGTTLSWLRPFDGPGSDRITSLAIGGGVMVAAGDFSSDLDLGFGTRTAIDQDAFIVVMDPFTGELIADAVFGGNGDVVVRAVEARAMGDQTRIYVVGSFESELDAFASSPVQIALGESDGFIAAFDLIR